MTNSKISELTTSVGMEIKAKGSLDTKKSEEAGGIFAALMNQSGNNLASNQTNSQSQKANDIAGVEPKAKAADYWQKEPTREAERIKPTEAKETVSSEDMSAKADEVGEEIKDIIEDELGVTEEELTEVVDELGMTMLDLLIPSNLTEVVAELTGSEDVSSLLLSDEFTDVMQAMTDVKQDLADALGITVEEMQAIVEEMNLQAEGTLESAGMTVETDGLLETTELPSEAEAAVEVPEADEELNFKTASKEEVAAPKAEATERQTIRQTNTQEDSGQSANGENEDLDFQNEQQTPTNEKTESNTIFAETNLHQNMSNQPIAEANMQPEVQAYRPVINVADIINQISEYTKLSVTPETTSLEMQLNPANLGKVYLQISTTKDGNVSATLTTQNEVVREALEAQAAELRQNLNQQGVKVTSIEVTVSTHEFERNLEQNAEGEKQQAEQRGSEQRSRRSLNLNSLDELSGLMSEEEMLAAKIMQDNGNTMDVIA